MSKCKPINISKCQKGQLYSERCTCHEEKEQVTKTCKYSWRSNEDCARAYRKLTVVRKGTPTSLRSPRPDTQRAARRKPIKVRPLKIVGNYCQNKLEKPVWNGSRVECLPPCTGNPDKHIKSTLMRKCYVRKGFFQLPNILIKGSTRKKTITLKPIAIQGNPCPKGDLKVLEGNAIRCVPPCPPELTPQQKKAGLLSGQCYEGENVIHLPTMRIVVPRKTSK